MSAIRILSTLILLLSAQVLAQPVASPPPTLVANGYAAYSEMDSMLFLAALFVTRPSSDVEVLRGAADKRMEFKIIGGMSARRFVRLLLKSTAINNKPQLLVENAKAMETFVGAFQDTLEHGDHIEILPDRGSTVLRIDGVELARIDAPGLFTLLLNMWIGDVPPSRDFKARILGLQQARDFENDFNAIAFAPDRARAIQGWRAPALAATPPVVTSAAPALASPAREPTGDATLATLPAGDTVSDTPVPRRDDTAAEETLPLAAVPEQSPRPDTPATQSPRPDTPATTAQHPDDAEARDDEFSAENLLAQQFYASKLLLHSQQNMRYPDFSRRMRHEGNVQASVTIDREGRLLDVILTERTEYSPLNDAVIRGIKRSVPFPAIPDAISGNTFTFIVPVAFKLGS